MTRTLPTCDLCSNPVRWSVELTDLARDTCRSTRLCGVHARPFREQRRTAAWDVTRLSRVEYGQGWNP